MLRIGLLALAAAAFPLLARATPDLEAPASTATETPPACSAPVPRPLLDKNEYSDREFEYAPDNAAIEKASSGTVHIEIRSSGCRGGVEHAFIFIEDKPLAPYGDLDHWIALASRELQALRTYRRGRTDVNDLLDFLSGARIATPRRSPSEIRLEVCRDGSPYAKDGCPAKSGGGWRFAVRALDGGRMRVMVSRYLGPLPPSK